MNRILVACVLISVTSQLSSAVILRPKWFPYFVGENNRGNLPSGRTGGSHGATNQPSQAMSSRQARTVGLANRPTAGYARFNDNNNDYLDDDVVSSLVGMLHSGCKVGVSTEKECLNTIVKVFAQVARHEWSKRRDAFSYFRDI